MKPILSGRAREQRWRRVAPYVQGSVLDIGCSFARLPDRLAPQQRYVSVDMIAEAVRISQERYPEHAFFNVMWDASRFNWAIKCSIPS
jgi:hypothetical protein